MPVTTTVTTKNAGPKGRNPGSAVLFTALSICTLSHAEMALEETVVIGEALSAATRTVSPISTVTAEDLQKINFATVEDALANQPSVVVRRRFIGDPNGVIGIRGSNMFQGTHTLVYADGMPLHYHLQTRFSGAPRWSLVAPSEVKAVDIIYGPFSAEYSGNAIGGVVNIKTRQPQARRLTLEGLLFNQDYQKWSTDENYLGGRAYLAFEDAKDNFNFHLSYNHLENESQPQTQYATSFSSLSGGESVNGSFVGQDPEGEPVIYYGDSGAEKAISDLIKRKSGYDFGAFQVRANIAYEERQRDEDQPNNFVRNDEGNKIWNGEVTQAGRTFTVNGSNFEDRHQERDSLLLGLGLSGYLNSHWIFDAFYSNFRILDDQEIRTARNPNDPDYLAQNQAFRGRITEYDDTGWDIVDVKFGNEALFGSNKQRITFGFHHDAYELNLIADDYNAISGVRAADEIDGNPTTGRSDSGGEASTQALFAQYVLRAFRALGFSLGAALRRLDKRKRLFRWSRRCKPQ